jgi:hypothetical protein
MASFKVNMNVPELKAALAKIDQFDTASRAKIGGCIQASTINIANGARRRIRVKSGRMQKSIKSKYDPAKMTGTIRASWPAVCLEFGHKGAHEVPVNKKALLIGGDYFSSANIPKVPAYPFMRPAYEDEKPNLINSITKVLGESP